MSLLKKISFITLCLWSLYCFANDIPAQILETLPQLVNTQPQINTIPQQINSGEPIKVDHIFQRVIVNEDWQTLITVGSETKIMSMSISRQTNKKNELGLQKHSSDIIIFIIEGKAIADINDNRQVVQPGEMILIPRNTPHNLMNLDKINPLKILIIYTKTNADTSSGAYDTHADEHEISFDPS